MQLITDRDHRRRSFVSNRSLATSLNVAPVFADKTRFQRNNDYSRLSVDSYLSVNDNDKF